MLLSHRNVVTALWYIAQALGVLLNVAVVQLPVSLVYQFFLYFSLMLLVTVSFTAINCSRTCRLWFNTSSQSSTSRHNIQECVEKKEDSCAK